MNNKRKIKLRDINDAKKNFFYKSIKTSFFNTTIVMLNIIIFTIMYALLLVYVNFQEEGINVNIFTLFEISLKIYIETFKVSFNYLFLVSYIVLFFLFYCAEIEMKIKSQ